MEDILKEILLKLNKLDALENQLMNLTEKQMETNQKLTKIETSIENTTNTKIQVLFEDRQIVHDKLDEIQEDIRDVKKKVDNQDIKIQVIDNRVKAIGIR